MTTTLDKETYIKLAEAYCKQHKYEEEVRESVLELARKYGLYTDFIGLCSSADLVMNVLYEILGDNFNYYFYEFGKSFEKFNNNVTLEDGSHPNVQNFGDLWEFENGEEEAEKVEQRK